MAYLVLYLPCLLLAICSIAFKREAWLFGIASLFIAASFAGLRAGGTDYDAYLQILKSVKQGQSLGWIDQALLGKDFLFGLFAASIFSIGADVQAVFFAAAALALTMKAFVFQRLYRNIAIPLFIYLLTYYILHEFIQIRAALAISSCFIAAYYLLNKRPFLWLLFSVIAIGWHISAFAFLIFSSPFLFSGKIKSTLILLFVMSPFVVVQFISSFPEFLLGRSEYVSEKIGAAVVLNYLTASMAFLFFWKMLPALDKTRQLDISDKEYIYFSFYMMTIGICMYMGFSTISGMIAYRYLEFFDAFSVIMYSYFALSLRVKIHSLATWLGVLVLFLAIAYHLVYMLRADLYKSYISFL